jgi:hypothetical protein
MEASSKQQSWGEMRDWQTEDSWTEKIENHGGGEMRWRCLGLGNSALVQIISYRSLHSTTMSLLMGLRGCNIDKLRVALQYSTVSQPGDYPQQFPAVTPQADKASGDHDSNPEPASLVAWRSWLT